MHIKTMKAYKACFDWLLKLWISSSIHLKATHVTFTQKYFNPCKSEQMS